MPRWAWIGAILGIVAFIATLAGNLVILAPTPATVCQLGVVLIPLAMLLGFILFVGSAAAAGLIVGRADGSVPLARQAGAIVGIIAGAAIPTIRLSVPALGRRIDELSRLCPVGGSFSFGGSTPPPEIANQIGATPPPGAFVAFGGGGANTITAVVGMAVTILIGIGIAVVAAQVGGSIGIRRPAAHSPG